jgi:aldehyde dehydrogenase (NAD+)
VLNVVTGTGAEAGAALVAHPDVDMISFTGSVATGRQVAATAAGAIKRVTLELGGKSPNLLLEDVDGDLLSKAVSDGLGKCFLNAGQTCNALTRMLVPRARLADVEAAALTALERWPVGDPSADGVRVGPLVSAAQRERVRAHIAGGIREGARLVAGGVEPPEGLERGFFVRPTVLSDVRNDMAVAQEEIFGPVLVIVPYDSEDEAVELANDSRYGLAGGVWSADRARAEAVARRLRTGQVEVNGGRWNPVAPFGGYKQSGHGRELGRWGLDEYLELKAIQR